MATTTTNYGFNIAEGSDTVNLLTQCYPNFTSIDQILFPIEKSGTTTATVTKAGTVHQIVRVNSKCDVLRFVATANYAAGDTFTVDGASVTATSVSGEALPAGAFVINQSVLAILNGSVLTVLAGGKSDPAATDVSYSNATSGLIATNVQTAIDEVVTTFKNASNIDYSNTVSGLTATDVQSAIDEIAAGGGGSNYDTIFNRMFTFTKSTITVVPTSGTASAYHILEGLENVDRELFKIDGTLTVSGASVTLPANTQMQKVKVCDLTGFTVLPPTTAYDTYIGTMYVYVGSTWQYTSALAYLHVETDGTLSVLARNVGSGSPMTVTSYMILFLPSLFVSIGD